VTGQVWPPTSQAPDYKVEEEAPARNGLYCCFQSSRECGADCMAYLPQPAADSPALGPQQRNCVLIVSIERLGRYSSGIVQALIKRQQDAAIEAADRKRQSPTPPPNPRGP
jgi:hypothetical protein